MAFAATLFAAMMTACGGAWTEPDAGVAVDAAPQAALTATLTSPPRPVSVRDEVTVQGRVTGTPDAVSLEVDGSPIADLAPPYRYTWDARAWPEGPAELRLVARRGDDIARSEAQIVTIDRSAPFVVEVRPAPGLSDVQVSFPIELQLSEPVLTSSGAIQLTTADGRWPEYHLRADGSRLRIQLEPLEGLPTRLIVGLTPAITDLAGNPLTPLSYTYGLPPWLVARVTVPPADLELAVAGHTADGTPWFLAGGGGGWSMAEGWLGLPVIDSERAAVDGASTPALVALAGGSAVAFLAFEDGAWSLKRTTLQGLGRVADTVGPGLMQGETLWYSFVGRDAANSEPTAFVGRWSPGLEPTISAPVAAPASRVVGLELDRDGRPVVVFTDPKSRHHIARQDDEAWEELHAPWLSQAPPHLARAPDGALVVAAPGVAPMLYDVVAGRSLVDRARLDIPGLTNLQAAFGPDGALYVASSVGPVAMTQVEVYTVGIHGTLTPVVDRPPMEALRSATLRHLSLVAGRPTVLVLRTIGEGYEGIAATANR